MNAIRPPSPAPAVRLLALGCLAAALPTQESPPAQAPPPFDQQNVLTPFRDPGLVYAPPDAVYRELRIMQKVADDPATPRRFDSEGREICDHPAWRAAYGRLQELSLDLGYLAEILRRSGSTEDRDTALYGAFFGDDPNDVFNLIAHIPGEPVQRTREKAYPRAIAYIKAHLGRQYGDLTDEEKAGLNLPEIGSPAAKAMGLTRAPRDEDFLYGLNLIPFFQLLWLESQADQAQGLWFLKECAQIRRKLVTAWLEPAAARIRELLGSKSKHVRAEAMGLLTAVADTRPAPPEPDDVEALAEWGEAVLHDLFPPIRWVSQGLMVLGPGEERDAIVAAAVDALRGKSIGQAGNAVTRDGKRHYGFRVLHVPEPLEILGIPDDSVIATVNGTPIRDGLHLLEVVEEYVDARHDLIVELVHGEELRAIEYRIRHDG